MTTTPITTADLEQVREAVKLMIASRTVRGISHRKAALEAEKVLPLLDAALAAGVPVGVLKYDLSHCSDRDLGVPVTDKPAIVPKVSNSTGLEPARDTRVEDVEPICIDILLCPFCGKGEGKSGVYEDEVGDYFQVICSECGAKGPSSRNEIQSWKYWNYRALTPASPDVLRCAVSYIGAVATCQQQNTSEWMEYLAEQTNEFLAVVGQSDRVKVNRRGNIEIDHIARQAAQAEGGYV